MEPTNSNAKRPKISDEESCPVDRISNLPDFVLSHILSFLPTTKESVKTSILSKRWRNVWTSVDKLKVNSMYLYAKAKKRLPGFVYKFLKVYQGSIKEFSLSGHDLRFTESDVISWIDTAVSRGVERLEMDISFPDRTPNWPLSIYSSKTLVDMEMWCLPKKTMDIPTMPIFPCLKKLEVSYAKRGFFKNIVSRCSALEHLIVGLSGSPIDIVSPSVKRLELDFSGDDQKIVLRTPSLQYLNLCCVLPFEFIVEEQLSALIEADIFFREYPSLKRNVNVKQIRESFERFIQTMSNVKLLRIRFYGSKFFNSIGHGLFVNLTKLEIVSSYFEWKLLVCFMESSIKLEAITLQKNSKLKKHKLAWKDPKKVPTSLSSSLKKISIDEYTEEELPMVTYVLRTAKVLEQVKITCAMCYRDKDDLKFDMLQSMQKLPRASEGCKISLV